MKLGTNLGCIGQWTNHCWPTTTTYVVTFDRKFWIIIPYSKIFKIYMNSNFPLWIRVLEQFNMSLFGFCYVCHHWIPWKVLNLGVIYHWWKMEIKENANRHNIRQHIVKWLLFIYCSYDISAYWILAYHSWKCQMKQIWQIILL